jgi:hypothetical protein
MDVDLPQAPPQLRFADKTDAHRTLVAHKSPAVQHMTAFGEMHLSAAAS